ncbi:conserved hypothetical protein [Rhodospirillum centenum SW]|uniref:Uncharacterized protein n=1 Tax=Rhodospirillum centenum (strain ATCC 51521 / SW) TaxID=414684 RepID=B6IP58_RHOCS|nr:conserved hypothetical protein [Rhodospirillum centenum SW]
MSLPVGQRAIIAAHRFLLGPRACRPRRRGGRPPTGPARAGSSAGPLPAGRRNTPHPILPVTSPMQRTVPWPPGRHHLKHTAKEAA